MKTIRTLVVAFALFGSVSSFATVSELVGSWTAIGSNRSWDRIDISNNMIATAFRTCRDGVCEGRAIFRLTTYGRTEFFSPLHNVATGEVRDKEHGFTATEILELKESRLVVREYIVIEPRPGGRDGVIETTFTRLRR
ncbi:MAG: hypothetical protein J7501_12920 [Bdellovibrio sp.]|nr:hypothetical protein [Bdellovibrio sp.]